MKAPSPCMYPGCHEVARRKWCRYHAKVVNRERSYPATYQKSKPTGEEALRTCLGKLTDGSFCNRQFKSQHRGHRLCPICSHRMARLSGEPPACRSIGYRVPIEEPQPEFVIED